jgi:hypothetical protein
MASAGFVHPSSIGLGVEETCFAGAAFGSVGASTFGGEDVSEQPEGHPAISAIASKPNPTGAAFQISFDIQRSFESRKGESRSKRIRLSSEPNGPAERAAMIANSARDRDAKSDQQNAIDAK